MQKLWVIYILILCLFIGSKVTVHRPINLQHGDLELALYGSFLPVPSHKVFDEAAEVSISFMFNPSRLCWHDLIVAFKGYVDQ